MLEIVRHNNIVQYEKKVKLKSKYFFDLKTLCDNIWYNNIFIYFVLLFTFFRAGVYYDTYSTWLSYLYNIFRDNELQYTILYCT